MIIRNSAKIVKVQASLTAALTCTDNIPGTQEYDEATGTYYPDWSILGPIVVPDIRDADGTAVPDSDVANKAWYVIGANGAETQITSADTAYELWPAGYPLGIKVKANLPVGKQRGLVFRFKSRGFEGMAMTTLQASNNPAPTPDLELDFPTGSAWNPFSTGADVVTVTPRVRDYGKTSLSVKWQKRDGNAWRDIDPTDPRDCELELDAATQALSINRRWMGEKISLVCRLTDNSGSTPVVLRERPVTIRRRIPEYTADIFMPSVFDGSEGKVMAEAYIKSGTKRIADPDKELKLTWYDGTTVAGTGNKCFFPVKNQESLNVGLDVADRGPLKLLTFNGAYLTLGGVLLGGR